jgi:hypothetical protein
MKLGILGHGWGYTYAKTLDKLGIDYRHDRTVGQGVDGVIVATPAETHYEIARDLLKAGIPIILEKPVTLDPEQARELVTLGGIAFAGHTRLYDPSWRSFKASLHKIESIDCIAGGTSRDPWWDWGPHLVAMCLDVGFDPRAASIRCEKERIPLSFIVNGTHEFRDVVGSPTPLEVLCTEFVQAIELGEPNNAGLVLGAEVVEFLCLSRITPR